MRLCFLIERRYAPYSKWLGSAFRRLDAHALLGDAMLDMLGATDFARRGSALVRCLRTVAATHNRLAVTRPVDESVGLFHEPPYRVLGSSRFGNACLEQVSDPSLLSQPLVGAVDQLVDSVDVLAYPGTFGDVTALYAAWSRNPAARSRV